MRSRSREDSNIERLEKFKKSSLNKSMILKLFSRSYKLSLWRSSSSSLIVRLFILVWRKVTLNLTWRRPKLIKTPSISYSCVSVYPRRTTRSLWWVTISRREMHPNEIQLDNHQEWVGWMDHYSGLKLSPCCLVVMWDSYPMNKKHTTRR